MIRLFISLFALVLSCSASAQDTFYYSGGKKIELEENCGFNGFTNDRILSAKVTYKNNYGKTMWTTGYLYVKLKSISDSCLINSIAKQYDLTIVKQNEFLPLWFVLHINENGTEKSIAIANKIFESGLFAECSPDFAMSGEEISYDPMVSQQWGVYNGTNEGFDISASEAWNYATGRGVVIAIIDEGVDLTHDDLKANRSLESYDADSGMLGAQLYGDHGTHCAGIAAAGRNNGIGITGVAPDAKIMAISASFYNEDLCAYRHADAINWAWKHGADVISCSWSCPHEQMVVEAIDSALVKGRNGLGCVVVKSAGNDQQISFPGYVNGVIPVASIQKSGTHYNRVHGPEMFISAPGAGIVSTIRYNKYRANSGTSMAAPHVSGVAALMLEANPALTVSKVREILALTAKKLPTMTFDKTKEYGLWGEYYGYGLVDAASAVKMVLDWKM